LLQQVGSGYRCMLLLLLPGGSGSRGGCGGPSACAPPELQKQEGAGVMPGCLVVIKGTRLVGDCGDTLCETG